MQQVSHVSGIETKISQLVSQQHHRQHGFSDYRGKATDFLSNTWRLFGAGSDIRWWRGCESPSPRCCVVSHCFTADTQSVSRSEEEEKYTQFLPCP